MPATQRRRDTGLIGALLRNPHRFGFFQAVRLLERWLVRRGSAAPGQAVADRLRFPNSSSLAFPASEIAAIGRIDADGPGDAEDESLSKVEKISLTPAFFGLLGAQGALPHYYTETLAEHESSTRERGTREFLDIFSTRAAALFYEAWKKYRLPVRHELDKDHHYLPLLLAIGGLGHPSLRDRLRDGDEGVFDESLAHHAGALQKRPVSSVYLERVLADYFELPVRIEPFVGRWHTMRVENRTKVGDHDTVLGVDARVGERIWLRNLRMRVWIGPLDSSRFNGFLPCGGRARALERLLKLVMGPGYEYEVRVVLRKDDVHGCALSDVGAGRLGYDAFLCTRPEERDREDLTYEFRTSD